MGCLGGDDGARCLLLRAKRQIGEAGEPRLLLSRPERGVIGGEVRMPSLSPIGPALFISGLIELTKPGERS